MVRPTHNPGPRLGEKEAPKPPRPAFEQLIAPPAAPRGGAKGALKPFPRRRGPDMPAALSLPRISTNVRFTAARLLAPDHAGALAERLFLTPPRPRLGAAALDLIDPPPGPLSPKGPQIPTVEIGWQSRERAPHV